MSVQRVSIDVSAPPDVVFDFLTDPEKVRAWATEQLELESSFDVPLTEGTKFHERFRTAGRVADYDGEVTACDRPRTFATHLRNAEHSLDLEFQIEQRAACTHVEMRSTVANTRPIARVMVALFGSFTQRMMARRLWLLKRAVEDSRDVT